MRPFTDWLNDEIENRGWSQSELARRGGFSHSLINQVLNGHTRPGMKFLQGVARAFQMQPEEVYRLAGQFPPKPASTTLRERRLHYRIGSFDMTARMIELFEALDADEQELVVLLLERLAQARAEPRIVGEAADESG